MSLDTRSKLCYKHNHFADSRHFFYICYYKDMLKKFIISLCISLGAILSIGALNTNIAYAYDPMDISDGGGNHSSSGNRTETTNCRTFLGMVSWDCGTNFTSNNTPSEGDLKTGIWQIAVNVAQDITVIASYLIIAYVIYGGYLYMFSGGEGSKVATGKKALTQGFIGLAIVISAGLIMSTIRFVLVGNKTLIDCATAKCTTGDTLFISTINWVITVAGIVSVIFLIYGGVLYITSTGEPGKIKKAKDTIMYSLIGLAIVALAATITAIVSNAIRDANKTSLVNQTLISKEVYEIKNN